MSNSSGIVDFAIGLVNSVFNLPDGQLMFLRNSINRRTVNSILLVKKDLGLVEITSGLVNARFSLPEWQAVKMIFFAPCIARFYWEIRFKIILCNISNMLRSVTTAVNHGAPAIIF